MPDVMLNDPPDPFHPGERLAQERAGVRARMAARGGKFIRSWMPEQHRQFFADLPFVLVATIDPGGWPVGTIIEGPPGFVSSPDPGCLRVALRTDAALDPTAASLVAGAGVGVLGIELATRRRNRANGRIVRLDREGLEIAVEQSFGNCAQYIQRREIVPEDVTPGGRGGAAGPVQTLALEHGQGDWNWQRARHPHPPRWRAAPWSASQPKPALRERWTGTRRSTPPELALAGLDAAARRLIGGADTFFVASGAAGAVDMSHRGGRPGFVRVDGETLTIPDFAGNRYFNTLGNFLVSPRAGLLFIDFERGDLLHLSGEVEIVWDGAEVRQFGGAERLWRVRLTHGWRRAGAVALRWEFRDQALTTERTGTWAEVK